MAYEDGVTLVTCTGNRPVPFTICEKLMSQQTKKWDQWIVVDDGENPQPVTMGQQYFHRKRKMGDPPHTLCLNLNVALGWIKHKKVLFVEDDDYYSPDYIEVMASRLDHSHLVGERHNVYYHVFDRKVRFNINENTASMCATALKLPDMLGCLKDGLAPSFDPYVDLRLWRSGMSKGMTFVNTPRRVVIGMKGMPGRVGVAGHDTTTNGVYRWEDDTKLEALNRLMRPEDVEIYKTFWREYSC